ncbi:MAG: hypothetical protein WBD99_14765 [Thermodesulfobacteriota bacterium]
MDRQRALDDGLQRDITGISKEAGLFLPVFITSKVLDNLITNERNDPNFSDVEKGIIKVILSKLVYLLRVHRQTSKSNLIYFNAPIEKDGKNETALLLSLLGPIDSDDHRPCITIMLPEEYPAGSDRA